MRKLLVGLVACLALAGPVASASAAPGDQLMKDTFSRNVNGAWGTGDTGTTYTCPTGNSSDGNAKTAVDGNFGYVRTEAGERPECATSQSVTGVRVKATFSLDRPPTTTAEGEIVQGLQIRESGSASFYEELTCRSNSFKYQDQLYDTTGHKDTDTQSVNLGGTSGDGNTCLANTKYTVDVTLTGSPGSVHVVGVAWKSSTTKPDCTITPLPVGCIDHTWTNANAPSTGLLEVQFGSGAAGASGIYKHSVDSIQAWEA